MADDLAPAFAQVLRIRRKGSLHAHFDGLKGTQKDVGKELGRGGSSQIHDRLVGVGEELLPVPVFEDLVQAVLSGTLERVSDKSGRPAEEDAAHAFFGRDGAPCLHVGLVDGGIDLATTFDQVEGGDRGMGGSASDDAADHASGKVLGRKELAARLDRKLTGKRITSRSPQFGPWRV